MKHKSAVICRAICHRGDVSDAASTTITVIQSASPAPLRARGAARGLRGPRGVFCVKPHQRAIKKSLNGVLKIFPIMGKVLVAPLQAGVVILDLSAWLEQSSELVVLCCPTEIEKCWRRSRAGRGGTGLMERPLCQRSPKPLVMQDSLTREFSGKINPN